MGLIYWESEPVTYCDSGRLGGKDCGRLGEWHNGKLGNLDIGIILYWYFIRLEDEGARYQSRRDFEINPQGEIF